MELSSEELNTKYVSSDESSLTFRLESSVYPRHETFRVPYELSYELDASGIVLKFNPVLKSNDDLKFTTTIKVDPEDLKKDLTIQIRDSYFSIDTTKNQGKLGQLFIDSLNNQAYLFTSEPIEVDINRFTNNLEICSDEEEYSSFEYSLTNKGLSMKSRNADACVSARISDLVALPPTSSFKLSVAGNFDDLPCVYTPQLGLCENLPESKEVSYFGGNDVSNSILRLYSRSFGSTATKDSLYTSIVISPLEYITAEMINPPIKIRDTTYSPLTFKKVPFFGGNILDLHAKTRYCKSGEIYDAVQNSADGHTYVTSDDEICTSIEFPYIPHTDAYVLEIKSKYVTGMPLRFCLTNEFSKKCDKYVELSKSTTPVTQYFLIPPGGSNKGYTFNISTLSFGGVKSENALYYAALIPVTYRMIADAPIIPIDVSASQKVFVHNQAFESGWMIMCGLSPCKGQHVLVNGWANGWVVDSSIDTTTIKVIFWPQVLEYIGLGVLFISGAMLFIRLKNNYKVAPSGKTPHN
jgi:hypothetical protein